MTTLQHLSVVHELARNTAPYSEFRVHLIAIEEALEAFSTLQTEHANLNESLTAAKNENADIYRKYIELKPKPVDDAPSFPRSPLKHI